MSFPSSGLRGRLLDRVVGLLMSDCKMQVAEDSVVSADNLIELSDWRDPDGRYRERYKRVISCQELVAVKQACTAMEVHGGGVQCADDPLVYTGGNRVDYIDQAREHIELAAQMLLNLGTSYASLAWVLKDALDFLDEI